MKRVLLIIGLIAFGILNVHSQSISVFNLDQSQFPKLKAKMFVLNANGDIAPGINKSDIIISEDGIVREVSGLDCPIPKPPDAISAVLTIDVSGSMSGNGIIMAKSAANAWVQAIPLGKSECAITSFDSQNYLNCDFTTDRQRLLSAIELLKPQGGTDFNAALIDRMFGSLILAERSKHKKAIVFLTDGYASGSETEIVSKANAMNATIYCVVLGNKAPEILKNIATRTGGECFDQITDAEQAENCYKSILNKVQGGEPCTIEWLSDGCPDNRKVNISVPKLSVNTNDRYSVSFDLLPQILILPNNSIRFGPVPPGNFITKSIKLISGSQSIRIDSITNDNKRFKVLNFPVGGIVLNAESQAEFSVEFLPFDSAYQFTRFNIHANACKGNYFYASGGFNGGKNNTLSIIEPNGGEVYSAGADTTIKWDGIPASDTVLIEISTDGGFRWQKISDYALGLSHRIKMPNSNSNKCLVRIKQLESTGSKLINFRAHTYYVRSVSISTDSKLVATCGEDKSFKVFDIATGQIVHSETSYLAYRHARFSPDGSKIAIAISDYSIKILSAKNWSQITSLTGTNSWVDDMAFSGDGTRIASLSNDNGKRSIKITDLTTQNSIFTEQHTQAINRLITSPDGNKFITTSSDGTIKIWDAVSGSELKTITASPVSCESISSSPEGTRLAVSTNNGSQLSIIDIQSGQIIHQRSISNASITDIAWSYDGQSIATATDKGSIILFSGENYDSLRTFQENPYKVNDIEWSRDSKYLVAGTNDNYVRVWNFELIIQEAVSENYWSIISPKYSAKDLSFDKQHVGTIRDSIFTDFVINTSSAPFGISKYEITGADAKAFALVSNIPPLSLTANQSEFIELQFRPFKSGMHSAQLNIYSQFDTTKVSITGEGYAPKFSEITKYIDFGQVDVDTRRDTTVKIFKNNSNSELIIEQIKMIGPDMEQFYLPEAIENISIAANKYFELSPIYFPISRGRTNTAIEIYFRGEANPAQVQLLGEGLSQCGAESFNIDAFQYKRHLEYLGHTSYVGDTLEICPAKKYGVGGASTRKRIPADSGFISTFSFMVTDPHQDVSTEHSYPGGDGLSFVIHNDTQSKIGLMGSGIGYEGISNAIAIELDLFKNDSIQPNNNKDPNGNHLAVFTIPKGENKLKQIHRAEAVLQVNPNIPIIRSDGTIYYMKVEYSTSNSELLVYLDSVPDFKAPAIMIPNFRLSDYIYMASGRGVFLGIFSGTGSTYQATKVLTWQTCTAPNATSVPADVEYSDDSGENIRIYPNPCSSEAKLIINSQSATQCVVRIYNTLGESISSPIIHQLSNTENTIELPDNLPQGMLIIKIEINGETIIRQLIKM